MVNSTIGQCQSFLLVLVWSCVVRALIKTGKDSCSLPEMSELCLLNYILLSDNLR